MERILGSIRCVIQNNYWRLFSLVKRGKNVHIDTKTRKEKWKI